LQRSDHRKHHEDIYKIGHTNDFNRIINEYPINTHIISVCAVDNDKKCECELIKEFKSEFDFRNNLGYEYFKENERDLISVFNDFCSEHLPHKDEEVDMDYHWQIENKRITAERNQRRFKK
jgi:hypothetical protein